MMLGPTLHLKYWALISATDTEEGFTNDTVVQALQVMQNIIKDFLLHAVYDLHD